MRIIRGWIAAALGAGLLVGCTWDPEPIPTCSDDSTLDLVRQILAEHALGTSALPAEALLRQRLTFRYPRAMRLEENIKKYTCQVDLVVVGEAGTHDVRLAYESQIDDAGDHLVYLEGIALGDVAIIRSALDAAPAVADPSATTAADAPAQENAAVADTASPAESPDAAASQNIAGDRTVVLDGTAPSGDHPRFRDYPVESLYAGPAASLNLSGETAKTFRTRLREALAEGRIVAGGEYVAAGWGCGAGCFYATFVNKRTGQVVEEGIGGEGGQRIVGADPHSRLVIAEGPEYDDDYNRIGYYAYFYELVDGRLVQIRKTPVAPDPEE